MSKAQTHRLSAITPLVCSALALLVVVLVLITGWERHLPDEGAAAHLFQLLIATQLPLIGLFLLTAQRGQAAKTWRMLGLQLIALCAPLSAVAAAGL